MVWVEVDGKTFNLANVNYFDNFSGTVSAVFDDNDSIMLADEADYETGQRLIRKIVEQGLAMSRKGNDNA